jgi:hypothetical protein
MLLEKIDIGVKELFKNTISCNMGQGEINVKATPFYT